MSKPVVASQITSGGHESQVDVAELKYSEEEQVVVPPLPSDFEPNGTFMQLTSPAPE